MKKRPAHTARIAQATVAALLVLAASGVAAAPAWASGVQIPTLTNDVGQPSGGTAWQLPFGIALLVGGLLAALMTFAAYRRHASRIA